LIYAIDSQNQFNTQALELFEKIDNGELDIYISERSLYELVAVLSSYVFANKITLSQIKEYLSYLNGYPFTILYSNFQITNTVWRLFFNLSPKKNSLYDLVLAATAIEYQIEIIYTKNVKYFENINEVEIIDPFYNSP
jgi:predicted nucleic acid-binding protein